MKKYNIFFLPFLLLLIGLISADLNAQVYQGEKPVEPVDETTQDQDEVSKTDRTSGRYKTKFKHLVYFMPNMTTAVPEIYGPFKIGAGPKWGIMFETGAFRFFSDNFMLGGAGNIGLYSSFGIGASFHDFKLPDDFSGLKIPFFFADLKLGPDIRLEFIDFMKVDLYGNIGVLASYGGFVGNLSEDETFYKPTKPAIAFQTGVGLNVALGRFVLGVQYTMAKGTYEFEVSEDPTLYPNGPDKEAFSYKDVNLNSLRLHIGFYTTKRRR
ncbi:MAG: hypothetical protein M0Q90_09300 [Bacteroidales bacterium]|nr:hypothetical protein [Bacteroidales bacterium]